MADIRFRDTSYSRGSKDKCNVSPLSIARRLYTNPNSAMFNTPIILASIFAINCYVESLQIKRLFIGSYDSKEPMIGAKVYSFIAQKCYHTDFYGIVEFEVLEGDSFQIEQTGYRLAKLHYDAMVKIDSAYLKEIGSVDLGSTGIEPIIAADTYLEQCKCCRQ